MYTDDVFSSVCSLDLSCVFVCLQVRLEIASLGLLEKRVYSTPQKRWYHLHGCLPYILVRMSKRFAAGPVTMFSLFRVLVCGHCL